jgi:protein TonB
MKNFIVPFVLVFALVIGQGCSKTEESSNESAGKTSEATATLVKSRTADEIAATRAKIAKASAEKEAQRKLAVAEKAKASPTYKDAAGNIVYYKAEIDPSYVGGFDELTKYLKANLKYPEAARRGGYEGTVFVDFVIDAKGRVREVVASDVIGDNVEASFKEESVRVVAAMPGWIAGRQQGKAVDASFSIPITFQLED